MEIRTKEEVREIFNSKFETKGIMTPIPLDYADLGFDVIVEICRGEAISRENDYIFSVTFLVFDNSVWESIQQLNKCFYTEQEAIQHVIKIKSYLDTFFRLMTTYETAKKYMNPEIASFLDTLFKALNYGSDTKEYDLKDISLIQASQDFDFFLSDIADIKSFEDEIRKKIKEDREV